MAIIKFDSEKADALIRDLNRISSDIESSLGKVYNNSYGKEINLSDSRLKVYAYRNKTIDVTQEDGTVVQETVREKYLKHDFVANARLFNKHVRNIFNRSNSAKTKATKSIESVVNSLNKIKALISEYESEQSLKMSNSLDDVGQFNFNFLAAYGPMGRPQNYSHSFGTIVADDAYTSLHLGVLGQRPTSLNLEKLEVFDGMLDIARNNGLSYQEKFELVQGLLMENVLEVNPEEMQERAKLALESMIGIADSKDMVIDDNLRIESLVRLGIPVIEDYDGNLAIDIKTLEGTIDSAVALSSAFLNGDKIDAQDLNIDTNGDGKPDIDIGTLEDLMNNHENGDEHKKLESQLGINSDVTLDVDNGGHGRDHGTYQGGPSGQQNHGTFQSQGSYSSSNTNTIAKPPAPNNQPGPSRDNGGAPAGGGGHQGPKNDIPKETPKNEPIRSTPKPTVDAGKPSVPANNDVVENPRDNKPVVIEDTKPTAEDMAIDQEIQSIKIENNYKEIAVTDSSTASDTTVEIDDAVEKKGAGILAGAAGIGALSNMGGNSGGSMPQVNGMAAGELLGINTGSDAASMGLVVGNTPGASASTGNVTTPSTTNSSVGGESTADRGSLSNGSTTSKPSNTSNAGRGGATLEDKNDNKDENSYGKPNKPGENEDTTKKGLLGDASIAELDAKDEKEIKVATGVTAATTVTAGVLALFNVFPWIMILLALIAIGAYAGYRIKKKKNKEKRAAELAALKAQEAANATVTMEAVTNVSDATDEVVPEESTVLEETTTLEPTAVDSQPIVEVAPSSSDEFSEQPYEPSRDGMTEIGGTTGDTEK